VSLEPSAADLIALLGDGSFRDTHGTLQKVIHASKDSKITVAEVEKVTGAPKAQLVNEVVEALAEKNIEKGLSAVAQATNQNIDMSIFVSMILNKIRAILLVRYSSSAAKSVSESMTESDVTFITTLAKQANSPISSHTLTALLDTYTMIGKAYAPYIPLEIALFELAQ
jgi:DNA polymerase-3 subunit gamma/tau